MGGPGQSTPNFTNMYRGGHNPQASFQYSDQTECERHLSVKEIDTRIGFEEEYSHSNPLVIKKHNNPSGTFMFFCGHFQWFVESHFAYESMPCE